MQTSVAEYRLAARSSKNIFKVLNASWKIQYKQRSKINVWAIYVISKNSCLPQAEYKRKCIFVSSVLNKKIRFLV